MNGPDETDVPAERMRMLTSGWARIGLVTWIAVLLCNVVTAVSSRTVGKPPWWLGPSVDPAPLAYLAVPVVLVMVPVVLFARSDPRAPLVSCACAVVLIVVAVVDIGSTPGVATVELSVALAALLASVATNAGVFARR